MPAGGSSSGRTADSDSANQGSNPCPPAIYFVDHRRCSGLTIWSHRLAVRTLAFHVGNRGSSPLGITIFFLGNSPCLLLSADRGYLFFVRPMWCADLVFGVPRTSTSAFRFLFARTVSLPCQWIIVCSVYRRRMMFYSPTFREAHRCPGFCEKKQRISGCRDFEPML